MEMGIDAWGKRVGEAKEGFHWTSRLHVIVVPGILVLPVLDWSLT